MLLHDGLELCACDLHRHQGVVVLVDVHRVLFLIVALFQVAGGVEQRRQGYVGAGIVHLHFVDQVHQGGILHLGGGNAGQVVPLQGGQEVGGHIAHHGVGVLHRGLVYVLHGLEQFRVLLIGRGVDELGDFVHHGELAVFLLQGNGQLAHVGAVGAGLHDGDTVFPNLGESLVGVADHKGIHLGIGVGHLIHAGGAVLAVPAIVYQADEHVHLVPQLGHHVAGLLHGGGKGHVVIVAGRGGLPLGDVGRVNAEYAYLDPLHLEDGIGLLPAGSVGVVGVGDEHIALEKGDGPLQHVKVVIELVVAQFPHVVPHEIHGVDHGMDHVSVKQGDHVGLDGIAAVQQQQVRVFFPLGFDHRGHPGQTCVGGGSIHRIIVGRDGAVQVAGFQNGNGDGLGLGQHGRGAAEQHGQGDQYR